MPRGKILVRVNGSIPGFHVGQTVAVEVDDEGTPLELLWRRRLRDARVDGCCEIVKEAAEPKPKKTRQSVADKE